MSKPIIDNNMAIEFVKATTNHAQLILKKKRMGESLNRATRACDSFGDMMRDVYVCGPADIFKDPERRRDFEDDAAIFLEKTEEVMNAYRKYIDVVEASAKAWVHAVRIECEHNLKVSEHIKLDET